MPTVPFGRWPSPLTAAQAAAGKTSLSDLCSDGTSLYWLESRPTDGGRVVFVQAGTGGTDPADISPPAVSIRSRVHEYGGGAVCLVPHRAAGAFAYVDLADQRVWLVDGPGAAPVALTPAPAEGLTHNHGGLGASADGRWVLAVREVHDPGQARPRRSVVALGTTADASNFHVVCTLAEGHDFYGAPRMNPAGTAVATVVWDHPDLPWDASALVVTPLVEESDPATGAALLVAGPAPFTVAGGPGESVGQPRWRGDGSLLFVSDRQGWWQPHTHPGVPGAGAATALTNFEAEFHGPDWGLGQATMAERTDDHGVLARATSGGRDSLVALDATDPGAPPRTLAQPCVAITGVCAHAGGLALVGAGTDGPSEVWILPAPLGGEVRRLRAERPALPTADVSVGEPFTLVGRSGRAVHGVLFPPAAGDTQGPEGRRPPLIVHCHGGPTGAAGSGFDLTLQYFTSRGFAVAAVDYAGSTGYGRAYRCALWGQWGVADAEDCVDAARHLAGQGRVDAARTVIRGGSAGGFTALNALAAGDAFAAAVILYGVTDLLGLAASTHDFEAHYLDRLVGPLPASRARYEARSPVHRAAEIRGSVLLLQGTDDPVVPPAQAERLRDAMVAAGRRCVVRFFEGEAHGFRRAETLVACLEEELAFYRDELKL
jgi:dipeptidyl aminopeptidase/acylaminoacyl peptidase